MIWDCFLFDGEVECVEIRAQELAVLPDAKHLAITSDASFRGDKLSKTSLFAADRRVHAARLDDLYHFESRSSPHAIYPREREARQRNAISEALAWYGAKPDDVVIISDADEIPSATAVKHYEANSVGVHAIHMKNRCYWIDAEAPFEDWPHARIMRRKDMEWFGSPDHIRLMPIGHAHNVKEIWGGWHLSWLGGADRCLAKLGRFSHTEVKVPDREALEKKIAGGFRFWDDLKLSPTQRTYSDVPKCVADDPARWADHLWSKP